MADAFLAHAKPFGSLGLIGVGMLPHIPRQRDPIDLCRWLAACAPRLKALQPPDDCCHPHAEPIRYLGDCKLFLLSNGQNLTAKIY